MIKLFRQVTLLEYLIKRYLFWILLATCIIAGIERTNLRTVRSVHPASLLQPEQTALDDQRMISFDMNEYHYELTPLFDYTLNGLIVSKFDYDVFNMYKYGRVFPSDLCMIWGHNMLNQAHLNKTVFFSQDCRSCSAQWSGSVDFKHRDLSNNHLVIKDPHIRKILNGLSRGDQVQIKGKLVNVYATLLEGNNDPAAPNGFEWKTSTVRTDTAAGACEVIYVEELKLLKKGNPFAHYLFIASFFCLVALSIHKVVIFIRELKKD